jgi:hypothetical protein
MRRQTLIRFLLVLGGPAIALLAIAGGCAQPWQLLDVMCGHNAYTSLLLFTLVVWAAFVVVAVYFHVRRGLQ